jgi:ankyrin repeat protein
MAAVDNSKTIELCTLLRETNEHISDDNVESFKRSITSLINDGADVNAGVKVGRTLEEDNYFVGSLLWCMLSWENLHEKQSFTRNVERNIENRYLEVLELLLINGADPNKKFPEDDPENRARSSLFYAATNRLFGKSSELLLQYGADPFDMTRECILQRRVLEIVRGTAKEFVNILLRGSEMFFEMKEAEMMAVLDNPEGTGMRWFYNPNLYKRDSDKARVLTMQRWRWDDGYLSHKNSIELISIERIRDIFQQTDTDDEEMSEAVSNLVLRF